MAPVFFLMGPTATGKTDLALALAEQFPIDLISVDAGQVYREMDIGTAKPAREILKRVPHQLIDISSPWEVYSAGRFRTDARAAIEQSLSRQRIPFLVGGTAFYFKSLEEGLSDLPPRTTEVSKALIEEAKERGWPHLYQRLQALDPKSAREVSPNDSHRILRLFEVCLSEGHRASDLKRNNLTDPLPYRIVKLAVVRVDREAQNQLIRERFLQMLDDGLLSEAKRLYQAPQFDASLPSMRCVGYQQAWQYFEGALDYDQMVAEAVRETCSIAKRQMTWIRNQAGVTWVPFEGCASVSNVARLVASLLSVSN